MTTKLETAISALRSLPVHQHDAIAQDISVLATNRSQNANDMFGASHQAMLAARMKAPFVEADRKTVEALFGKHD